MSAASPVSPLDHPAFSDLDRHFARLIERLSGGSSPEVALAAALASHFRDAGHSCVDLREVAGSRFPAPGSRDATEPPITLPPLEPWVESLRGVEPVGAPSEFKPLILDSHGRLYLHRYWSYEDRLAKAVRLRSQSPVTPMEVGNEKLSQALRRHFPSIESAAEPDWQQVAVFTALTRRLCIISGGPGTGKTHTAAIVLAALLECYGSGPAPLRIALAAPTGKAALRLEESVSRSIRALGLSDAMQETLPAKASTIHRLLGVIPESTEFRHDADRPLPFDVIVVDEASMVDLALMSRLIAAVRPDARLILLGDRDQLASVEAGAVLGDLCHGRPANGFSGPVRDHFRTLTGSTLPAASAPSALGDCIVILHKTHRFESGSRIQDFAGAINAGEAARALALSEMENSGIALRASPDPCGMKDQLRPNVLAAFSPVLNASSAADALVALGRFRILCALRRGPFGVETVNRLAEELLCEAGLVPHRDRFYRGRPVLVLQNDYERQLFNGDLGVVWPDPATGKLATFFPGPEGALRSVATLRLPQHETAFAMTVHKCQGSEFEKVLFILPDRESPILTRELVYTGVTRARRQVELWVDPEVFSVTLSRRTLRASGMIQRLWEEPG